MEHRPALITAALLILLGASACAVPSSPANDAAGVPGSSSSSNNPAANASVLPPEPAVSPSAVAQCSETAPAPLVTNVDPSLVPATGFQQVANSNDAAALARADVGWLGGSNSVSLSAPAAAKMMSYGNYLALNNQPANENSVSSARCVWVVTVIATVTRSRGPDGASAVTYDSYTVVLDAGTGLTVGATAPSLQVG